MSPGLGGRTATLSLPLRLIDHMRLNFARLLVAFPAILGAGVVAPAAAADARPGQSMTFEAPRDLLSPLVRKPALDEIAGLGVRDLRVILSWKDVAPKSDSATRPKVDLTDPASYAWGEYDNLMAAAKARGIGVYVTLSSPVPKWATASKRDFVTRPNASEFRKFATAVARRYGDQVGSWALMNEPNLPQFLRPQVSRGELVGPKLYRELYLAGRAGLLAGGQKGDRILFGELSPKGSTGRLAPIAFLRSALCLDDNYRKRKSCGRVETEGIAHHAYTTKLGPSFVPVNRDDVTIRVISRMVTAMDRAARAGAIPRQLPLYLTEFGIQSTPDKVFGVDPIVQNEFRAISERIAWENPRVVAFSQYLLRDDDNTIDGRFGGFETGLRYADGRAKPSLSGFRLPLVARVRPGGRVSIWGLVRPAGGVTTVELQVRRGGGAYRLLRTIRTDLRGSFVVTAPGGSSLRWRLLWTAPGGQQFASPPVRAYK